MKLSKHINNSNEKKFNGFSRVFCDSSKYTDEKFIKYKLMPFTKESEQTYSFILSLNNMKFNYCITV
jgi:hypothetical protein